MKRIVLVLALVGVMGCSTALKSDKIVSVKSRSFGLVVGQSPANETPQVELGFNSLVIHIIPTSTNTLYCPRYADVFKLNQGLNPFGFGVEETTGAGDVEVGWTNSNSIAVLPKLNGKSK